MRALVVANPRASGATARQRDVLVRALGSEVKVDLALTERRGHAQELARQAALDGLDVVVAFGGDGTVNEAVNGLLADGPHPDLPALGILPCGSANVLARSLRLPRDPVEAAGVLLDAVREGRRRVIGLGAADERYFTFCAGLGLDAEVVSAVERRRATGVPVTPSLYVRTGVRQYFLATDRRRPALTLDRPDAPPVAGLHLVIAANSAPWTYLGSRPVNPCPGASFDRGLDLVALRSLALPRTLAVLRQILSSSGRPPHGRHTITLHDQAELTLTASRPVALQVDGDSVGRRTRVVLRAVPRALAVLA